MLVAFSFGELHLPIHAKQILQRLQSACFHGPCRASDLLKYKHIGSTDGGLRLVQRLLDDTFSALPFISSLIWLIISMPYLAERGIINVLTREYGRYARRNMHEVKST